MIPSASPVNVCSSVKLHSTGFTINPSSPHTLMGRLTCDKIIYRNVQRNIMLQMIIFAHQGYCTILLCHCNDIFPSTATYGGRREIKTHIETHYAQQGSTEILLKVTVFSIATRRNGNLYNTCSKGSLSLC